MRLRRLGLLIAAAALALLPAARASAALLISIDKSAQQMTVSLDDEPLYTWPVSTGRRGFDTPNGTFKPFRMERDHYSREWDDAPMPYSMFFTQNGHAIHGTNHRITGQAASHGCVRLSVKDAATLWALVKQQKMANTVVVLTGRTPAPAPLVAQQKNKPQVVTRQVLTPKVLRPDVQQQDQDQEDVAVNADDDVVSADLPPPGWRRNDYRDRPRYYYYRAEPSVAPSRYYRYGGYPFYPYGR
jgi:hypothetical protein